MKHYIVQIGDIYDLEPIPNDKKLLDWLEKHVTHICWIGNEYEPITMKHKKRTRKYFEPQGGGEGQDFIWMDNGYVRLSECKGLMFNTSLPWRYHESFEDLIDGLCDKFGIIWNKKAEI